LILKKTFSARPMYGCWSAPTFGWCQPLCSGLNRWDWSCPVSRPASPPSPANPSPHR